MDEFTSLTNDRGLYKKILKEGINGRNVAVGNKVTISYSAALEDGRIFDNKDKFDFVIGSDDVILGMDKGILTMKKGEKSIFVMRYDYAYGEEGFEKVPPNSSLIFSIDLLNIEKNF